MADRTQTVNLGCGTLILLALIVMFFSNSGSRDVDGELGSLRATVEALKKSVDAQTEQIRGLQDLLKKRESPTKAEEPEAKKSQGKAKAEKDRATI
jgi:hypothetical protein